MFESLFPNSSAWRDNEQDLPRHVTFPWKTCDTAVQQLKTNELLPERFQAWKTSQDRHDDMG